MKIIKTFWFTSNTVSSVGVVVGIGSVGKRKAYIGVGFGQDEQVDANRIANFGAKLTEEKLQEILKELKGDQIVHEERSELAGRTVRIKKHINHFQYPDFGGSEIKIEDWQDRMTGKSWIECGGNPACIVYAARISLNSPKLILDTEGVLYGYRKDGLGSLVHISELEI